jgi:LacI family transcriptional regulator
MAVKLKDIARKVGVSATTVSLVLNQSSDSRISESTRNKILEVAKELGYKSSRVSQPSLFPVPPTIGLVIPDIKNPFFTELSSVIEDVTSRYGYNIILCNTQENLKKENEFLEALWRRRVDGLIIAPVDAHDSNVEDFLKRDIPVVLVDRYLPEVEASTVLIDNVEGAFLAIDYLIGLGHTRIGFLKIEENITTGQERLQGYLKAFEAHKLAVDERLIVGSSHTAEGGRQGTQALLSLSPPPSAIFASGGTSTLGALMEFRQRGVRIPRDISFIRFDDEQWNQFTEPPLSAVAQPIQQIGTEAAQLLIQLIQGWGKGEKHNIVLKSELIIRESCKKVTH